MELHDNDKDNMKTALEAATDMIVNFNGKPDEEWTELDFAKANDALDFMKFIVSGIMYANQISVCVCGECEDHDSDWEGDDDDVIE